MKNIEIKKIKKALATALFLFVITSSLSPAAQAAEFSDVAPEHSHINGINYFVARNISTGYEDGTFKPDNLVTRAGALKFIYKSRNPFDVITGSSDKFTDVPADAWYAPYVATASSEQVVKGMSETTFGPGDNVTKTQYLKMLFKVHEMDVSNYAEESKSLDYTDIDKEAWYMPYLYFARGNSIIGDTGEKTIGPNDFLTRGEVATITYKFVLTMAQMKLASAEARIAFILQKINEGKLEEVGDLNVKVSEILDKANGLIPENPTVRGASKFARAVKYFTDSELATDPAVKKQSIEQAYQYAIDASLISDNQDLKKIAIQLKMQVRERLYELMTQ